MIVLIDTDILIDVALDRAPFASYSSAILDYSENDSFMHLLRGIP